MGKKSRAKRAADATERRPGGNSGLTGIIGELINNRQYDEAYRAAAVLIEQDPLNAEAHAIMALLMSRTDRHMDALRHYELAIRLGMTHDATLYAGLAMSALTGQLIYHALLAARQGAMLAPSPENQQMFRAILDAGQKQIALLIGNRNVPVDVAERAMVLVERSARARIDANFERAGALSQEAVDYAPGLPAVWYNLAILHWSSEEIPEAIGACEQGMEALQEQNAELLALETRIQAFSAQTEAARRTLERLAAIPTPSVAQTIEIAKGHAALDDDQSAYDLLSTIEDEEELPQQLLMLGEAAANLGKRDEARTAWRPLVRDKNEHARAFSEIMARNEKPPTPGGRFPYFTSIELAPSTVIDRLVNSARVQVDPTGVAEAAAQYPALVSGLCEAFMLQLVDPRFVVQILLQIPDEITVEAIRAYAISRLPSDYDRLFAHIALRGAELVDAAEPASVWIGGRRHSIVAPALRLKMPKTRAHSDEVSGLLRDAAAAQRENNLIKAIDLYRHILVIEPDATEAEHNLGTALMLSGRADEGEGHIRRSLELDDSYAVAYCNLASLELSRGRTAEAAKELEPLDSRRSMTIEEIIAYLRTKADVVRAEGDTSRSDNLLHCLLAFDHGNAAALEALERRGTPARTGT